MCEQICQLTQGRGPEAKELSSAENTIPAATSAWYLLIVNVARELDSLPTR